MNSRNDAELISKALAAAAGYFVERDRMNALVHLSEVRWSPITDLVTEAAAVARRITDE
jgi:hypothetical protein